MAADAQHEIRGAVPVGGAPIYVALPEGGRRRTRDDERAFPAARLERARRHALGGAGDQPIGEDIATHDRQADPRRSLPVRRRAPLTAQRQPGRHAERDPYPQGDDEDAVAIDPARPEGFEQADPGMLAPTARGLERKSVG